MPQGDRSKLIRRITQTGSPFLGHLELREESGSPSCKSYHQAPISKNKRQDLLRELLDAGDAVAHEADEYGL